MEWNRTKPLELDKSDVERINRAGGFRILKARVYRIYGGRGGTQTRTEEFLQELAEDMAANGQRRPVMVRPMGGKPGIYEMAGQGASRLAAARRLGWEYIWVCVLTN